MLEGAVIAVTFGTLPLALVLPSLNLIPTVALCACAGAIAGFFYDRGYIDAEKYWRQVIDRDLKWRIEHESKENADPARSFGRVMSEAFDGPNGRIEPDEQVRLDSPARVVDDELIPASSLEGRYLGIQLVDDVRQIAIEIAQSRSGGSYRIDVPVEDADRLTKITNRAT